MPASAKGSTPKRATPAICRHRCTLPGPSACGSRYRPAVPSHLHEVLLELFRQRPSLAAELLSTTFGLELPEHEGARVEPAEFTDLRPTQYRADTVVALTDSDGPVLAVVVEVQLRPDEDKRWSWPVYLASLRAREQCPVVLLVVCPGETVAAWCRGPVAMGHPGWDLVPLVLGPESVPVVTDPAEAVRSPELAVLSAMAHGRGPDRERVLDAFAAALGSVEQDRFTLYSDVVLAALPVAARHHLEALVKLGNVEYEYQSEFVRKYVFQGRAEGRVEGRVEGEANAVLAVLDARGIEVSDVARAHITGCADLEQLDAWVRRAVSVASADDLFA
jgi:hypothetical protein